MSLEDAIKEIEHFRLYEVAYLMYFKLDVKDRSKFVERAKDILPERQYLDFDFMISL